MSKKFTSLLIFILLCILAVVIYNLPPVNDRLAWRLDKFWAEVKYAIHPPEEQVFVPSGGQTPLPAAATQSPAVLPTFTATIALPQATSTPTDTPTLAPSPTLSPTPLPLLAQLKGILHEYQTWNNCGPANLAMALSYWGWKGDQTDTATVLKPNQRDKNVMPYEMEAFVDQHTDLQAIVRLGGDLPTLKAFISAGFPVLVEKGFEGPSFDGWMGHYEVLTGYDDGKARFTTQDSYKGPNYPVAYTDLLSQWRAFNYTYLVIYPQEQRQRLLDILGLQAYDNFNYHTAEQIAAAEIPALSGRDLYFALFNRGSSLVALQDYAAAAQAYDAAFANYPAIPQKERPWRMLWYQTGPYFAYYYTARYQDVIDLATQTLDASGEPILEESFYWRARAYLALAQNDLAIKDLRQCLVVHEGFQPCIDELTRLGLQP
jgi:hypothetical protein